MTFGVLNMANRFRYAITRIVFDIDQQVIDRFRHSVVTQVANRV